mgnify:CR=1 FL=1
MTIKRIIMQAVVLLIFGCLALEKNPRDLYNYYFLAELRFDQKRYADALNIIDRGLSRGIRTNFFLEDKRGRWHLKELQKQINAKLDKK